MPDATDDPRIDRDEDRIYVALGASDEALSDLLNTLITSSANVLDDHDMIVARSAELRRFVRAARARMEDR